MIRINLKEVLEKKNLTMTDVHEKTNISKNTLSLMANNKSKGIQFDTLDKLLEFLSVDVDEIIQFTSQKELDLIKVFLDQIIIGETNFIEKFEDIFAPVPEKTFEESEEFYYDKIEKLNLPPLGYCDSLRSKINAKFLISYDNITFSFTLEIEYVISAIKNKTKVKEKFEKSQFYNGEKFEEYYYIDSFESFYIFIRGLNDKLKNINLSNRQKDYIEQEISAISYNNIPKSVLDFMKEYEVDDKNNPSINFF